MPTYDSSVVGQIHAVAVSCGHMIAIGDLLVSPLTLLELVEKATNSDHMSKGHGDHCNCKLIVRHPNHDHVTGNTATATTTRNS